MVILFSCQFRLVLFLSKVTLGLFLKGLVRMDEQWFSGTPDNVHGTPYNVDGMPNNAFGTPDNVYTILLQVIIFTAVGKS